MARYRAIREPGNRVCWTVQRQTWYGKWVYETLVGNVDEAREYVRAKVQPDAVYFDANGQQLQGPT